MRSVFLLSSFFAAVAVAGTVTNAYGIPVTTGGQTVFTPLHTYFMSPSGSDANSGLDAAHPWKTARHPVICGDVIVAAAGNYTAGQFGRNFGAVSGCPSSTGGIDGSGGIYFAVVLCGGADLAACTISTGGSGNPKTLVEFYNGQSNWALEGFNLTGPATTIGISIRDANDNCTGGFKSHHIASINNIVSTSRQAFGGNDCGILAGSSSILIDYVATVGMIVQNANQFGNFSGGICVGAIDFVGLGSFDTAAGTHAFMHNNYGINNQVASCVPLYDGHAFYIDSPDAHGFHSQAVISNNIGYQSTRQCIALTYGGNAESTAVFKVYNNTCFNNDVNIGTSGNNAEINVNTGGFNAPWVLTVTNNIAYVDHPHSGSGALYAWNMWSPINSITNGAIGGNGQENVYKGALTSCENGGGIAPTCDPSFNILNNNGALPPGSNFFVNPVFTNTADLLANRIGVPNCAGFINTTQCMGWNATTGTLTTPSVISDLTASCAQCGGKGFQRPSVTCAANADFPTWLKGIVYLHWTGTAVEQRHDLVTTPCGL
jgi:hypothetical protein